MDAIRGLRLAGFQVKVCRGTDAGLRVINRVYPKKTAKGNENKNRVQNLKDRTFYPKALGSTSWIEDSRIGNSQALLADSPTHNLS